MMGGHFTLKRRINTKRLSTDRDSSNTYPVNHVRPASAPMKVHTPVPKAHAAATSKPVFLNAVE